MRSNIGLISLPNQQRGASVTGIILFIVTIVVAVKLGLAIIPAYIEHYQLSKSVAWELKKANENKDSAQNLIANLTTQWGINNYDRNPAEILTITNSNVGSLSVKQEYSNVSNFFANVDIVTHFSDEITAEEARLAKK